MILYIPFLVLHDVHMGEIKICGCHNCISLQVNMGNVEMYTYVASTLASLPADVKYVHLSLAADFIIVVANCFWGTGRFGGLSPPPFTPTVARPPENASGELGKQPRLVCHKTLKTCGNFPSLCIISHDYFSQYNLWK